MLNAIGRIRPQITCKSWAGIGHEGQNLAELIKLQEELDNAILEIDEVHQRVLVGYGEETGGDVWGCLLCFAEGVLCITNSEIELHGHCDENHEGWRNL